MRAGDVLEWIAGACLTAAALLHWGLPAALVVAGVVLAYEAQCYGGRRIPLPKVSLKVPKLRRRGGDA